MNILKIKTVAVALALAFVSAGATAQAMSKTDYQAGKDRIAAEYKTGRAACNSYAGNANDVCVLQAKGQDKVAKAELEASYKPSAKTRYDARVTKADANYEVAKKKCDDLAGNPKDVCQKEAKAVWISAKADAKASEKTADARNDALADKTDAQYAVARQKCDSLAGEAKDKCLGDAKARFGK